MRCARPEDLDRAAEAILGRYPEARIFALHGPMGAGKTTLVKAFCRVMGVDDAGASPTFALVNEYVRRSGGLIYHFDFYRIREIAEVFDIGYEDYFFSGHHCFLEWPERIAELLPAQFVYLSIRELEDGTRELGWKAVES
ncbi:MAG TPA: tRNA (adenosine(37)-N6)-threonylcarbamoyltransferase complex ATPase subunit type 1 TsaE [Bacteroidales bacterium]|nr:tRNA (adenosine(37)-N6)-threonylcarbamoyltransferase complex ATPase subunit type 1 TsaE [Bacteroidales bacterium]